MAITPPTRGLQDWDDEMNNVLQSLDAAVQSAVADASQARSNATTAISIAQAGGGGGGAVTSVSGRTGAVVLTSADVGLSAVNNTSDSSKPVSTAQAAAIDAKADALAVINAQTGTTYTAAQADSTKLVTLTNAAAITVTLPASLAIGTRVDFAVLGAGMATFVGSGGATITATPSAVTRATGSAVSAIKLTSTVFLLVGDLA